MSDHAENIPLVEGSVELELRPRNDGLMIAVYETVDSREVRFTELLELGRLDKKRNRSELCNAVRDRLRGSVDVEAAVSEFRAVLIRLSNGLSEEQQEQFRAPVVQDLLAETEKVEVFPAEDTTIRVTLKHDGEARPIEFTHGEWVNGDPSKLRQKYYNTFTTLIDEMERSHWEELREQWEEQKVIKQRETLTERERVVTAVLQELRTRLRVYSERDMLWKEPRNAWYDSGGEMVDKEVPSDPAKVWVSSRMLSRILEDESYNEEWMSAISQELLEQGDTFSTSRKKSQGRLYPFKPEVVGVEDPDLDVIYPDDGDVGVEI